MRVLLVVFPLLIAGQAAAGEHATRISAGYSFAQYLDEGRGDMPFGFYLSLASNARIGVEADIAYHRDTYTYFFPVDRPIATARLAYDGEQHDIGIVTGMVGPRIRGDYEGVQPFSHLLIGMTYGWGHDSKGSNLIAALGAGIDIKSNSSVLFRLAFDYQVFYDNDALRVVRLSTGLSF